MLQTRKERRAAEHARAKEIQQTGQQAIGMYLHL